MPYKKRDQKADVKQLVKRLAKQEFGGYLLGIQFDGPYEDEDLDVDLLLKEEPPDRVDRSYRVHEQLRKAGFDVLFGYDIWDELEADEKQNWQSLWTPVK